MKNPFFRNVDFIKKHAPDYFKRLGFKVLGLEGVDAELIFGGNVWYQVSRKDTPELIWTVSVRRQGEGIKWVGERIMNAEAKITNVTKNVGKK